MLDGTLNTNLKMLQLLDRAAIFCSESFVVIKTRKTNIFLIIKPMFVFLVMGMIYQLRNNISI